MSRSFSALPFCSLLALTLAGPGAALGAQPERAVEVELAPAFTPRGLELRAASDPRAARVEWRLAPRSWGRGDALVPLAATPAVATQDGVEYDHGGLLEWYRDDPRGLAHGFTVLARPGSEASPEAPLELRIAVGGARAIELSDDLRSARFLGAHPTRGLRYAGLTVWDASGRRLPAWFEEHAPELAIRVDDAGAQYPLTIDPILSVEAARLVPLDPRRHARFGNALALDGPLAVVGAYGDYAPLKTAGSAYVFRVAPGGWVQEAKLFGAGGYLDSFGWDVDVSGERVLVGAWGEGPPGNSPGAGYVFGFDGADWVLEAQLPYSGPFEFANMGRSVALSGDVAALGAPIDFDGSVQSGRVHVFGFDGVDWSLSQVLVSSDALAGDTFGSDVALDGDVLVAAAANKDFPGQADGAVYLFERDGGGWSEVARLTGDFGVEFEHQHFGWAVAVDGDTVAVGCPTYSGADVGTGLVYVFRRGLTGWYEEARLEASDASSFAGFGMSLDLDGDWLVAGSEGEVGAGLLTGRAYAFLRRGGQWWEQTRLQHSDPEPADAFGRAVAVSGTTALVGAKSKDDGGVDAGAAYQFELPVVAALGTTLCAGDGSGAACPCANESAPGSGRGCRSSAGEGAWLLALGSPSVSAAELGMIVYDLPPRSVCLLAASLTDLGDGVPFGDGLLCLGGDVVRLGTSQSGATGVASWPPDRVPSGPFGAGDRVRLQAWFREGPSAPCGAPFNTSQALAILLTP